ncbi:MAG TPA: RNA polymerase sigma factor, partial [Ktedonobacteraceae bacterium]
MQVQERTSSNENLQGVKRQQPEITDGMLVQKALAGDQQAFEALVRRYNVPLFNFICHCLGDYDLASDIAQQVFLQLYL